MAAFGTASLPRPAGQGSLQIASLAVHAHNIRSHKSHSVTGILHENLVLFILMGRRMETEMTWGCLCLFDRFIKVSHKEQGEMNAFC